MGLIGSVKRHFTKSLPVSGGAYGVYDLFKWKTVDVRLKNYSTGEYITKMDGLEFPEDYSQSACDIIAGKYFRKKISPGDGAIPGPCKENRGYEHSMKQVTHRMVMFWTEALHDEGMIDGDQKQIVYDELAFMILAQIFAPNSPQFFNTGLKLAYGLSGKKQGHFYFDEHLGKVVESEDAYTRTQGSACFIISVKDSLLGEKSLTDQITTETLLFKYGSGVGTNWSPIRAKDEHLSGGGRSSGLLSFLKVSDRNAGAIKSGGTTRRAAKMNILGLDHPEILDYIIWKAIEEQKVADLGKMGYSTSIDGDAYDTVSGQNSNNSVRIPDSFMKDLDKPTSLWKTFGRCDSCADGEIPVQRLWDDIAYAAWRCGDPGVQFDDTINAWHTCPSGEDRQFDAKHNRINASNPCSEYMFLDDTACNLASINVLKFYNGDTGAYDLDGYIHSINMIMLALEATIHWGQFPTEDIARKSYMFRTAGLGLTNIGALFSHMALPYDSDGARNIAAGLCSLMTGQAYLISSEMAAKAGAFKCYDINRGHMARVIANHARAAVYDEADTGFDELPYKPVTLNHEVLTELGFGELSETIRRVWRDTIAAGGENGYRNAQVSVLAPTGTIAFAMDCATTSSEPFFGHVVFKKLVGGGGMEIINPAINQALKKLGYTPAQSEDIIAYVMRKDENGRLTDGKIEGAPHLKPEHYDVFDTASRCGTGKRFISPEGHVRMMGALAPHVSGAISKTVNLPGDATVEDVKRIYRMSWELGVKAIALYRDGCKSCQPLSAAKDGRTERPLTDYTYDELIEYINTKKTVYKPMRIKPSGIRTARVHEAVLDGLKLYITTSFYEDGRLGEIYVSSGRQGSLTKGLLDSLSTTISEMLQYGVPPADIARMYRGHRFEPSGFISGHPYIKYVDSISDLISKIIDIELGNYTYCQVKPDEAGLASSTGVATERAKHGTGAKINADGAGNTAAFSDSGAGARKYNTGDYLHGEVCPSCKSTKLVKNGTCKVCTECGTTTGCS